MESFTDGKGQVWEIEITIHTARLIKSRTGINAYKLLDPEVMNTVGDDPLIFTDILWACVEKQAAARRITFEQFLTDAADVIDQALDKVWRAAVELLPEKKRPAARKTLAGLLEMSAGAEAKATTAIMELDMDATVASFLDRLDQEIDKAKSPTISTSSPTSNG